MTSDSHVPMPKVAWVVPTTRCNARCRTCQHHYQRFGQDMAMDIFEKVCVQLLPSLFRIQLVGLGEPLLAPRFDAMLETCLDKGVTIYCISNATLLTAERIRTLVEANADLMISLDGVSQASLAYLRPDIDLDKIFRVFAMLKECRDAHPESTFRLTTNTVVTGTTLHEMPDIVDFGLRHNVDVISFADLIPHHLHHLNPELAEDIPSAQPEALGQAFALALARARNKSVRIACPPYYHSLANGPVAESLDPEDVTPKERASQPRNASIFPQRCFMPWTHVNIEIDGSITSCCASTERLGSLADQEFADIWNGAPYQNFRRLIHGNNPPISCRLCNLHAGLNGGNPSFYEDFIRCNHCGSLAFPGPDVIPKDGAMLTTTDVGPAVVMPRGGRLRVRTGNAAFVLLDIDSQQAERLVAGSMSVGSAPPEAFDTSGNRLLLPLPPGHATDIDIDFDLAWLQPHSEIPSLTIRAVTLLADRWNAPAAAQRRLDIARRVYSDVIVALERAMRQWQDGRSKPEGTAVVFGFGDLAQVVAAEAANLGIHSLGFMDFRPTLFQNIQVNGLEMLSRLRPDVVLLPVSPRTGMLHERIRQASQDAGAVLLEAR